mgnify:FL=1
MADEGREKREKIEAALRRLEQLEDRLRAEEERDRIRWYGPWGPWAEQRAFHVSPAVEKAIYGGNQGGKTHAGSWETAAHILGMYPEWFPKENRFFDGQLPERPLRIRVAGESYEAAINQIIVPSLLRWIPRNMMPQMRKNNVGHVVSMKFPNGAEVQFMSFSQELKKWEGWVGHFAWFDEPVPESHYIATLRGLQRFNGRVILTMTPLDCAWIDRKFLRQGERDVGKDPRFIPFMVRLPLSSNLAIPEDRKEHWAGALALVSEEERLARLEGKPYQLLGQVYREWDEGVHVIDPPTGELVAEDWSIYHILDPHDRKPNAMLWVGVHRTGAALALWEEFEARLNIAEAVKLCIAVEKDRIGAFFKGGMAPPVFRRVIDPNYGLRPNAATGMKTMEEWAKAGYEAGYPMAFGVVSDDIYAGHSAGRRMLKVDVGGVKGLRVCRNCR